MTTCNDLVTRLVNGIIRQEGAPATALNPGNIRQTPWLSRSTTKAGMWVPVSRAQGIAGICHIVALHIAEGDSVAGFLGGRTGYSGYAPAADHNDPATYIKNVCTWANIADPEEPMWNLIEAQPEAPTT